MIYSFYSVLLFKGIDYFSKSPDCSPAAVINSFLYKLPTEATTRPAVWWLGLKKIYDPTFMGQIFWCHIFFSYPTTREDITTRGNRDIKIIPLSSIAQQRRNYSIIPRLGTTIPGDRRTISRSPEGTPYIHNNKTNNINIDLRLKIYYLQLKCPIWQNSSDNSCCFMRNLIYTQLRSMYHKKIKSFHGPHNLDIISLIVGSILSNSTMEEHIKPGGKGIRIIFKKYSNNVEYLIKFHTLLAQSGYCNPKRPRLYKLIGKKNKVLYLITFKTYSFTSFN